MQDRLCEVERAADRLQVEDEPLELAVGADPFVVVERGPPGLE